MSSVVFTVSAKDAFHAIVVAALQKDGWQITHDPYSLQAGSFDLAIDLGAQKVIPAELRSGAGGD